MLGLTLTVVFFHSASCLPLLPFFQMALLVKSFRETWKNDETMNEVPVGCMVITKPNN